MFNFYFVFTIVNVLIYMFLLPNVSGKIVL